ncbi:class I SAM-dependent methyltransferase, partial [Candidatus Pacearchaeota archaeon]|nr:class I SAM-dependent methyltransferase [Candidatus Pacearchaeota archaeon]
MSAKERLSKQEIKDKFDSFSKWYYIFEIFNSILIGRLRRGLLKQAKGKVLEIGIGTGANLKYYPTDCEITGIDLSKGMLTKAENKAAKLGIKINLREGDAENLPFKKEEFDSVVDTLGLCIYPNPIRALKEMKKVCKKKGRILLLEHGISNRQFIVNL